MARWFLFVFLICVSCNTPGPDFAGIPAVAVNVDGSAFDVRVADGKAQALRTNQQYAPRLGRLEYRARFAMEQVSGCKVTRIKGDQSLLVGTLSCKGSSPRLPVTSGPGRLECYQVDSWVSPATNEVISDFDCTWEN